MSFLLSKGEGGGGGRGRHLKERESRVFRLFCFSFGDLVLSRPLFAEEDMIKLHSFRVGRMIQNLYRRESETYEFIKHYISICRLSFFIPLAFEDLLLVHSRDPRSC